jgi:hypothetical protein
VVGALVAFATSAAVSAPAQAYVFRLSVGSATTTRPISPNFLGLAFEYNTIPHLAGAAPGSVNPVFAQLLHNLDPTGRPVIRVGGLSTDRVWWPVKGMRVPLGITYGLTPAWAAAARTLAEATKSKLILGINLEANRARISQVEASQLVGGVGAGNIAALEIGNEPDLYTLIPWYKKQHGKPVPWYMRTGTPVYSRRPSYGPQGFAQEFSRTLRVIPGVPIAGPETGNAPWMSTFSHFVSRGSRVRMLTAHAYGLNTCITDSTSPQYPSVPNLLNIANSRNVAAGLGPYISLIHRAGGAFRIDEMGSISCNGRRGVSDTLASALWLMDSLFQIASQGIDGVNLHSYPNSANGLFDFNLSHGQWQGTVHPLYYGALMFAQAAPGGSRLLRTSSASQNELRAWATLGADHKVRVLLINDDLHSSALARVRVARGVGPAAVQRLGASSAYATGGVSLGGTSFGAHTATGVLPAPLPRAVAARGGGYAVTLGAGSAALLTIARR